MTTFSKSDKKGHSLPRLSIRKNMSETSEGLFPDFPKPKVEVILKDGRRINMNVDKPEEKTVRWLKKNILEAMREYGSVDDVIGFKTTNKDYMVDFVLAKDEHDLRFLQEKILMTPIYKSGKN